tara:strand:+ start:479 stop:934 length:456 start_codon:yes stop_codon:yes gene_type:complete
MEVQIAVVELLKIVKTLQKQYKNKKFTLDGRLVGDLGEILVARDYDVNLYEKLVKHYDGETSSSGKVQIKTTMKDALTFPCNHTPEYFLGIKIEENGTYKEIFNGPGETIRQIIKGRKKTSNNLHSIKINKLLKLNEDVKEEQRVQKRDEI